MPEAPAENILQKKEPEKKKRRALFTILIAILIIIVALLLLCVFPGGHTALGIVLPKPKPRAVTNLNPLSFQEITPPAGGGVSRVVFPMPAVTTVTTPSLPPTGGGGGGGPALLDFGDAPDEPYGHFPSLIEHNGARHSDTSRFYLGKKVDVEKNSNQVDKDGPDAGPDDGLTTTALTITTTGGDIPGAAASAGCQLVPAGPPPAAPTVAPGGPVAPGGFGIGAPGPVSGPTGTQVTYDSAKQCFGIGAPSPISGPAGFQVTPQQASQCFGIGAPFGSNPAATGAPAQCFGPSAGPAAGLATGPVSATSVLINLVVEIHNKDWPEASPIYLNILYDLNNDLKWTTPGEHIVIDKEFHIPPGQSVYYAIPFINPNASLNWLRLTVTDIKLGTDYNGSWPEPFGYGETEDYFKTVPISSPCPGQASEGRSLLLAQVSSVVHQPEKPVPCLSRGVPSLPTEVIRYKLILPQPGQISVAPSLFDKLVSYLRAVPELITRYIQVSVRIPFTLPTPTAPLVQPPIEILKEIKIPILIPTPSVAPVPSVPPAPRPQCSLSVQDPTDPNTPDIVTVIYNATDESDIFIQGISSTGVKSDQQKVAHIQGSGRIAVKLPNGAVAANFKISCNLALAPIGHKYSVGGPPAVTGGGGGGGACSLTITNNSLPNAQIGVLYSQTLTASGTSGSVTWGTSSYLPIGLSLNSSTGELRGTPNDLPGTYAITFTASATGCTGASKTLNLTLN